MTDLHVHTNFCDGLTNPEMCVKAAIECGVERLGIVAHSYVPFDSACMPLERYPEFVKEVERLKNTYTDRIDILCGIEQDLCSPAPTDGFDFAIGSVHYIKQGGRYFSVDETPEILKELIDKFYGGDFYACAEDYFKNVSRLAEIKVDIVGHFDLIKKFMKYIPFDASDSRYRNAWKTAADALLEHGCAFEINTGGISRGYIDKAYPSDEILEYIKNRGGKLVFGSDAHRPENIGFGWEKYQKYL